MVDSPKIVVVSTSVVPWMDVDDESEGVVVLKIDVSSAWLAAVVSGLEGVPVEGVLVEVEFIGSDAPEVGGVVAVPAVVPAPSVALGGSMSTWNQDGHAVTSETGKMAQRCRDGLQRARAAIKRAMAPGSVSIPVTLPKQKQ